MKNAVSLKFVSVLVLTRRIEHYYVPTVSCGGGDGSSRVVVIEIPVIINEREFGRAVEKIALDDVGIQI